VIPAPYPTTSGGSTSRFHRSRCWAPVHLLWLAVIASLHIALAGWTSLSATPLIPNTTATQSVEPAPPAAIAPSSVPAPEPNNSLVDPPRIDPFETELRIARELRADGHFAAAANTYTNILSGLATPELQRIALLELGFVKHEHQQLAQAQQVLAQFIQKYPRDHALPEALLRQGLIYRQLGANELAITKFYAVMTAALSLKVDQFEVYQQLVRQAQTAIAETYFETGQYREAADFFLRLIRQEVERPHLATLRFYLIRSLAPLGRHPETITQSQILLRDDPDFPDMAQVRFLLATALNAQGRALEAQQQILLLLQTQHHRAKDEPAAWHYWQRRAGNELANCLYLQGDYFNALTLYQRLAEFDSAPEWQLPLYYQIGLVLERLEQPDQATGFYERILDRQKDLPTTTTPPNLDALFEMALWRLNHLNWIHQARSELLSLHQEPSVPPSPRP
jgi:tetratricopeptide (TPR) repeat protein